jgi:signal transduction histidine kinase
MQTRLKLLFVLTMLITAHLICYGGYKNETDSLIKLLKNRNTVTEAHLMCYIGSKLYRNFEFKEGLLLANEALFIGHNTGDESVIIRAHRLLADLHYAMADYDKSLNHFYIELKIHEKNRNLKKIAEVNCNIGVIYDVRGYPEKGLTYYLKALRLYEVVDDKEGLVATYSNLAHIYREQKKHKEAIVSFRKAAIIEASFLDGKKPHYFMVNIANEYMSMGEYKKALLILEQSDSILQSLHSPDDEDFLIWTDKAIVQGIVYQSMGNNTAAFQYFSEALNIVKKTGYIEKEIPVLILLGGILIEQNSLSEAETHLTKALLLAKETGSLSMERDSYKQLSLLFEKKGSQAKALEYFKLFYAANDSVISLESAKHMEDIQMKYDTENKEARIDILQKENEIQQLMTIKSNNQRRLALLIAVALLIIAGLYFNRYRIKKQNEMLLSEKNQQLALLNSTKDKFFAILAHDLKNPVSSFSRMSNQLRDKLEYLNEEDLRYYLTEITNSADSLNQLLVNLLQWAKSQKGQLKIQPTSVSIKEIIEKVFIFTQTDVSLKKISFNLDFPENMNIVTDENILITVLRNVIGNAVKFSENECIIKIKAYESGKTIIFEITDCGPGMTEDELGMLFRIDINTTKIGNHSEKGTGLGLILCKELLEKIEGNIRAESKPGQGSTFFIEIKA